MLEVRAPMTRDEISEERQAAWVAGARQVGLVVFLLGSLTLVLVGMAATLDYLA